MNKKCHWSLSNYLIGNSSWHLYGYALKLGSIMPDILVHTYFVGHKYDTTAAHVKERLADLEAHGAWTLKDCFRLGYYLHFLEDYFTYPHNNHFRGGFIAHCKYEFRLSKAIKSYFAQDHERLSLPACSNSIHSVLDYHHSEYIKISPSPENDAKYIISTSKAVAQEIFSAFSRQSSSARSLAFMARAGITC